MPLPPGMEWKSEEVTSVSWRQDNFTNNVTNQSDYQATSFTGATIASPIIMFLSGVVGNLLALRVLHRTRLESQRLMFHSLVAGLVWNDLMGIILTSPVTVASYINGLQMPGGEHLCRFNGFIMICFGLSTPLIVSAMAIERLLFVRFTFFYTKHCLPGAARLVMVAIWAFVLFFGLLPMFGFGSYVLQYPRTWCFLDFRTRNPLSAAYSYIYAILNLFLVITMIICNLVVVVTLARVRDYRRKYSNGSLNSVMVTDGVMDDTQRQQIVKRRKQKDIELHMIVVMGAITTIFAVCWGPLMIHIILSLSAEGNTADVFGLVAVRLASLNQTLNPWLYVILRRALIIRIKKYCCRWKKYTRKKPTLLSQPPASRRHQYVHIRNQLCHRNNFVGAEIKYDSLSHSLRKSLQKVIPSAASLPDVMMVNTGQGGMDIPLPDVARAESFAGRVSHSTDGRISCVYCSSPNGLGFETCLRERYITASKDDMISELPDGQGVQDVIEVKNNAKQLKDPKINKGRQGIQKPNGFIFHKVQEVPGSKQTNCETTDHQNQNSRLCSDKDSSVCIINSETPFSFVHFSSGQNLDRHSSFPKLDPLSFNPRTNKSQKKREKDLSLKTSDGSFLLAHSNGSRLQKGKHNSTGSSSSSRHNIRDQAWTDSSHLHNTQHSETLKKLGVSVPHESDNEIFVDTSIDSDDDDVFHDDQDVASTKLLRDRILTEDVGFSSHLTDSPDVSYTSTFVSPAVYSSTSHYKPFVSDKSSTMSSAVQLSAVTHRPVVSGISTFKSPAEQPSVVHNKLLTPDIMSPAAQVSAIYDKHLAPEIMDPGAQSLAVHEEPLIPGTSTFTMSPAEQVSAVPHKPLAPEMMSSMSPDSAVDPQKPDVSNTFTPMHPDVHSSTDLHKASIVIFEKNNGENTNISDSRNHDASKHKTQQCSWNCNPDSHYIITSQHKNSQNNPERLSQNNLAGVPTATKQGLNKKEVAYIRQALTTNSSKSHYSHQEEVSDDESEKSSGIFSAESPAREHNPKWQLKKESQSEPVHDGQVTHAQGTRRIKSYS